VLSRHRVQPTPATHRIFASAIAFHRGGQLDEALRLYEAVLAVNPQHAESLKYRGVALHSLGRHADALFSYDQALATHCDDTETHFNRGNALRALGRLDDALLSYSRAIAIKPDYVEAHNNRGTVLRDLSLYEEAVHSFALAVTLRRDYARAHHNQGFGLESLGRRREALVSYDRALALKPDYPEAFYNRGNTLSKLRRHQDALRDYERCLSLKPGDAAALINLGIVQEHLGQYGPAMASYDRALAYQPDNAKIFANRGIIRSRLNQPGEALAEFDKAIALSADFPYLLGNRLLAQLSICQWDSLEARLSEIDRALSQNIVASQPFQLMAISADLRILKTSAALYAGVECPPAREPLWNGERYHHDRLRIGYFSADFRQHAVASLIAHMIETHDRSRFEVVAFSFGPDQRDAMRTRMTNAFDQFFNVADQDDDAVAAQARHVEVDIAIDLMGFTQFARPGIMARRPAPLQVNYLGYPGTMGAPYMDYIIADSLVIPSQHFEHYSEKVVHLPHSYQPNDSRRKIAAAFPDRAMEGLPEHGFVFCCFNNSFKITADVFSIWMNLLKQVNGSVLWLSEGNVATQENLRREAQRRNVDPDRLIFKSRLPMAEHLARHRHADLFLDTFYYNAHTTASDALYAGLPVVTCLGDTFAGRVAASLLRAVGLPELITRSPEEYVALALRLATHPEELAALKDKLARNGRSTPLFDTALFTRHIEEAYVTMYQRHQQGLAPDHFAVAP